jgi:hypothetical protein
MKNLTWLADARSNVKSFPAMRCTLRGLGGQVIEIAAYDASGTYRAIYTVSIGESI